MANEKRNLIDQDLLIDSLGASDMEIFAKEVISEAPTVDAAPVVHGRWIGQRCSVCNESYMDYADADSYPAIGEPKPNYCPNCGAKMDGGNENG